MFDSLIKGLILKKILVYFLLIIISFFALFPIYWMVSSSFKPRIDWSGLPPAFFPTIFTWDNYIKVINYHLFPNLINSLIIAIVSTILSVFFGLLGGYVLSRFEFKSKNQIANFIISSRFMPPVVFLLPLFIVLIFFKLVDTIILMIILYTMMNSPFAIWMLKSFIDDIPRELDEAALVDGCSRFNILFRIIVPVAKSGIAVVAMFSFIFAWNEFILAFAFTRTDAVTIPLAIVGLARSNRGLELGPLTALATIGVAPVIILMFFLQRYIIRGLTFGALKE